MADKTIALLKELTEAPGISGYEEEIREIIRRHLKGITTIEQDRLGSILCRKTAMHVNRGLCLRAIWMKSDSS